MKDLESNREKLGAFCEMLLFLHQNHAEWTREPKSSRQQKLNKEIIETTPFQIINYYRLKSATDSMLKSGEAKALSIKDLLFLRPPLGQIILPALRLSIDPQKQIGKIHMALFTYDGAEKIAAIGFRFETPEEKGEKHLYHHAQLFRSFERNTYPLLPGLPRWIPDTLPAFPISAKSPFSLFLGVLIGIYGLDYLSSTWRGHRFFESLKEEIADLKTGCGYRQ
jgi:hypothetical protein